MRAAFPFAVLAAIAADGLPSAAASPLDEVLATDRAFAAAARRDGARSAFEAYAAPDAVMFRPGVGPIKGRAAVAATFHESGGPLGEWEPEAGEIAASGDLAYTWGYFRWTATDGSGRESTGNYVSVWRRIDGQWRWVVDLGVAAPPKAK